MRRSIDDEEGRMSRVKSVGFLGISFAASNCSPEREFGGIDSRRRQ